MPASGPSTKPPASGNARKPAAPAAASVQDEAEPAAGSAQPSSAVPADMVRVAAGAFKRGSPAGVGLEDERPQREINLATFDIDRTEVTAAAYKKCVAAGQCTAPACESDKSDNPETRPNHPVVCVPWAHAKKYCEWAGKRLPTEAEWEKAARGTDGRRYPWGSDEPSCKLANYSGCSLSGKTKSTRAVGSLPGGASPYGALDMAGNVWEWVADWHHAEYYAICLADNPPGPHSGKYKVVRGGAYSYSDESLETHGRTYDKPTVTYEHVGFRCARSVPAQ